MKQQSVKAIKLDSSPQESVTAFGGMGVVQRLALRLGVRKLLERGLPERSGQYSIPDVVFASAIGLLSGARGTASLEAIRQDPAMLKLIGVAQVPTGTTLWRLWEEVGEASAAMSAVSLKLARSVISRAPRRGLRDNAFVPVFIDGTLLEGSSRREGTKVIGDKGTGLLWTVGFVGPHAVDQVLCAPGEGEQTAARALIRRIDKGLLQPEGLRRDALVLMDSLHGDGPTFDLLEERDLNYVVGVNKLERSESVMEELPESEWTPTPEYDAQRGVRESAVCTAWLQCERWGTKRLMIGRRWRRPGEFLWRYAAVATNLAPGDKRLGGKATAGEFARAIWALYNRKGACENHFKNLLRDMRLHNPPCQQWVRNAGYYAIGQLAGLLGTAVEALTSEPGAARSSIATLRRWVMAVPGRVIAHARTVGVTILGLTQEWHAEIERRFNRAARC